MKQLNNNYIIWAFEAKIKSLLNELAKTTKKTTAKTIYKCLYEFLKFGQDCNIIDIAAYNIYIDEAKEYLYL